MSFRFLEAASRCVKSNLNRILDSISCDAPCEEYLHSLPVPSSACPTVGGVPEGRVHERSAAEIQRQQAAQTTGHYKRHFPFIESPRFASGATVCTRGSARCRCSAGARNSARGRHATEPVSSFVPV